MRYYCLEPVLVRFRLRQSAQQQGVGLEIGISWEKGWKRGGLLRAPKGFVLKGLGFFQKPRGYRGGEN